MKYDVAVLGSINLDVKALVKQYPAYGATATARDIQMLPGGKGANQAVAVAKLGGKLAFMGAIGNDGAGNQMIANLQANHIDTQFIVRKNDIGTGTFIVLLDSQGENTMVGTLGANGALTRQEVAQAMAKIDAPVLLLQMETSRESVLTALQEAKRKGMFVILDPAPADNFFEEALKYADCVTPNQQETEKITGIAVHTQEDAEKAAKMIAQKGVPNVIVKMGSVGNVVYHQNQLDFVPATKVRAVDTVGAGDTFAGAMATHYAHHRDLLAAVEFGNAAASIKVSRTGGQKSIPTLAEMTQLV
jgi:ribokinase